MERYLYWDCNAGISGDMAVAALLDLGASETRLMKALKTLPLDGFHIEISRVMKGGIECNDFNVILDAEHENHDHDMKYLFGNEQCAMSNEHRHDHLTVSGVEPSVEQHHHHHHEHRNLADVLAIIDQAEMTDGARELAHRIFGIIAEAESKAHGKPIDEVHFHEVGAIDSIVDVTALAVSFDSLCERFGITRVFVPYLCEGVGTIRCQHGILPIPVPATANIVSQYHIPIKIIPNHGEFVTPTGAAFIAATATDYTLPPQGEIAHIGLGAGKRQYDRLSILRGYTMEASPTNVGCTQDVIWKLETNIDDCTGEALGFVMDELFVAGAKDVSFMPCFMKKNRPAYLLNVICDESNILTMENIIFTHTTTIGIRRMKMQRTILERHQKTIETQFGPVRVKEVTLNGKVRLSAEYDDIAEIAGRTGKPFGDIEREIEISNE